MNADDEACPPSIYMLIHLILQLIYYFCMHILRVLHP